MCPLIVLKDGKPVLGSSAIGGGLHAKTLQVLTSVLEFGMDPQVAVERPAFMLPVYSAKKPVAQVERGEFDGKLLDSVRAMGQGVNELSFRDAGAFRGYWVGVQIAGDTRLRRAIGTRKAPVPSAAHAY
jgi:gamma-glutamyltranspeptidase / glutathione hydrolase